MFIFGMMPWKINFKRVSDYGARWYGQDWEFGRFRSPALCEFAGKRNAFISTRTTRFSVSIGEAADILPVATDTISSNDHIFHEVFPGLKTPFGLPNECFPVYEKMLDKKAKPSGCSQCYAYWGCDRIHIATV
jgi:hypothetical protein